MYVEAIDGSCGTLELPPYDEARMTKSMRTTESSAKELFWAQTPLRQMLRTCVGGSPLSGVPWKRLRIQMPAGRSGTRGTSNYVGQKSDAEKLS
jgi:hypothetical protein